MDIAAPVIFRKPMVQKPQYSSNTELNLTYGGRNLHAIPSGSLHVLTQGLAQDSYRHSHSRL